MTRLIVALTLWLPASAGAAPQSPGQAVVTARLTPDGVHAVVELDRAVRSFRFAAADVVRDEDLELLTPGLAAKGDEVTGVEPFRRFELRLRPLTGERDAKYPVHYRVGEGGVIYAPALLGDHAAWRTRLVFQTAPGHIRLPASGDASRGFVFLGPAALRIERPSVTVVAAPGTPAWLVERTSADVAAAVGAFTTALGTPLQRKPTLIVTHDDGRPNVVADVSPPGVITVRFHGASFRKSEPSTARWIQTLMLHETFHMWNGVLVNNGGNSPSWLHEGGAEYASVVAGHAAGILDDGALRGRLGEALTRCRSALKTRSLDEVETLSADVRYPCGMVVQWVADLHLRRATAGRCGVLRAWGDVVRIARTRPGRAYTLTDFYGASGFTAGRLPRPLALVLQDKGAERWDRLPALLNALGAEVSLGTTPKARMGNVMFHLLPQHCLDKKPIGFNMHGDTIVLDTEGRCGVLAGAPTIIAIEGRPLYDDSPALIDAVARKCASSGDVVLTTKEGRAIAARCGEPLPPTPTSYLVGAWRPMPAAR